MEIQLCFLYGGYYGTKYLYNSIIFEISINVSEQFFPN